jgi:hypothetical protein
VCIAVAVVSFAQITAVASATSDLTPAKTSGGLPQPLLYGVLGLLAAAVGVGGAMHLRAQRAQREDPFRLAVMTPSSADRPAPPIEGSPARVEPDDPPDRPAADRRSPEAVQWRSPEPVQWRSPDPLDPRWQDRNATG